MKKIQYKLFILFLVGFTFPSQIFSQNNIVSTPSYEVNKVYPFISVTEKNFQEAQTLSDLNYKYKSSWIKEYISVEISTIQNGKVIKALSKNDRLSKEQKNNLMMADRNAEVFVLVNYIPENNLKNKEVRKMDFTFSIEPQQDAKFADKNQSLKQYLKQQAIDNIPEDIFTGYDLAAVKFTVSSEGKISNAHVFESSKNEKTDELLLKTIQEMKVWEPAKYSNGLKVEQDFVLTVGNMKSCVVNLLSIRQYK